MKKLTIILSCICFGLAANAQHWSEFMDNPDYTNIYDIKAQFDAQFDSNLVGVKATGYKQFNRWFDFMEARCYPSGEMFDPAAAWKERMMFNAKESSSAAPATWKSLGPRTWSTTSYNPGAGRVNVVTVDPADTNIIYIGVPSGGLWKSTDAGQSWLNMTDHLPVLGVSAIAIHPTNSDIIYLGTGDGDGSDTYSIGVLKSTNGGLSWSPTGISWATTDFRVIRKVLIHPSNPDTVYAISSSGIYTSTDAGVTWPQTQTGSMRDVEVHPTNLNVVYACSDRFYKSTDGGLNFTATGTGLPSVGAVNRMSIAVCPTSPDVVYGLFGSSAGSVYYGLYKSINAGASWTLQSNSPNIFGYAELGNDNSGISWYGMGLAVNPLDETEVFVGGVNIWESNNSGVNWTITSHWYYPSSADYVHADIHTLDFYGKTLYTGSDGGIFRTTGFGGNWTDLSDGLEIMQMYRIGTSKSHPYIISCGAQDNGSNVRSNDSANLNWNHFMGADGFETIIHPTNPDIIYHETQNGGIRKTIDGGLSGFGIKNQISESGAWNTPWVMHPNDPETLYAGYSSLWVTYDGGTNWGALPISNFSGKIDAIAISESHPETIYVSDGSTLVRTTNDGITWTTLSSSLPNNSITYIAIHDTDPDKVWITMSGYNSQQHVFHSDNGGATWMNYSGNLPNLPANCVAYQHGSNGGIYVGTDVGVYYRNDSLNTWVDFSQGLPNVIVSELEIQYGVNKLRAGTYGRGLWESDLYQESNVGLTGYYQKDVKIYPMPSNGEFFVEMEDRAKSIRLVNQLGQEVFRDLNISSLRYRLKADGIATGTYLLQIEFETGILNKEVIIN